MVRLKGRTLTQPKLHYDKKNPISLRGSFWNLHHIKFQTRAALNNWACVRIIGDPRKDGSILRDPCSQRLKDFQDHLRAKGINVTENEDHGDIAIRGNDYTELEEFFRSSRDDYKVRFLLVVLPTDPSAQLYSHIKRLGDLIHGIHTVCVKADKANNFGSIPYDDNVALVSLCSLFFNALDLITRRLAGANILWAVVAASRLPRFVLGSQHACGRRMLIS